jgi:hypothetical protein
VTQAVFQGADLTEPLPFSRLSEPADGAGLDLVQARQLGGVDPEERALNATAGLPGVRSRHTVVRKQPI